MKIKMFSESLFRVCPQLQILIRNIDLYSAISHFQNYKSVIPVRGAIILNKKMNKALLVKGWKSNATWGFPRGKINKDEPDDLCAIREVYEEIGFDISPYLDPQEFIELTHHQKNFKLYLVHGIPGNTKFCPQTRKEISKIEWHDVNALPAFSSQNKAAAVSANQYFLVAPFMSQLAKFIAKKKGLSSKISESEANALKKLLGVSQNTDGNDNMVDRQTQASDLLKILNSPSKNLSSNDRNLLSGMFPTLDQGSGLGDSHIDRVKDALSFYQTEVDRKQEEEALQKVTDGSAPSLIPTTMDYHMNNSFSSSLPPQVLPPQPVPMGYIMQPNGPVPIIPFPQGIPGSMNMPYPMFPPFSMPPVPNQFMSAGQPRQSPEQNYMARPNQLPEPSRPPSRSNKALLALLAKNKNKTQTPLTHAVPTFTKTENTSGPSSSSQALLSLLQKPKPVAPPTEAPKEDFGNKKLNSNVLLDMLKPKAESTSISDPNSAKALDDSQMLLGMIKGNTSNLSSASEQPPVQNNINDDSSILLGMLHSKPQTSAENASTSNSSFQNQISIKDAIFGASPAPSSADSSDVTQKMNMLTVSDLESRQLVANNASRDNSTSNVYNDIPSNIQSGKDLLSFLHKGDSQQQSQSIPLQIADARLPVQQNSYPSNSHSFGQPDLLKAMFASAEASGNKLASPVVAGTNPHMPSPRSNDSYIPHRNDSRDAMNGQSLLSLIRGNAGSSNDNSSNSNILQFPSTEPNENSRLDASNVPYPAGPMESTGNQALAGLDSENVIHMPQEPVPYPQEKSLYPVEQGSNTQDSTPYPQNPGSFPQEKSSESPNQSNDLKTLSGQQLLAHLFGKPAEPSSSEEQQQQQRQEMVNPLDNFKSPRVVAGTSGLASPMPVAGEGFDGFNSASSNEVLKGLVEPPVVAGSFMEGNNQLEQQPSDQQNGMSLSDQNQGLEDFLKQYSTRSF